MKGQETVTKDGKHVHLYANIGSVSDIASVLDNDAEGVGLFRSEFLYLGKTDFPTEEEQSVYAAGNRARKIPNGTTIWKKPSRSRKCRHSLQRFAKNTPH